MSSEKNGRQLHVTVKLQLYFHFNTCLFYVLNHGLPCVLPYNCSPEIAVYLSLKLDCKLLQETKNSNHLKYC